MMRGATALQHDVAAGPWGKGGEVRVGG